MADFNVPTNYTLFSLVLDKLSELTTALAVMMDGTVDSNIPDGAKRYNSSNSKFEVYDEASGTWTQLGFHDAIDDHIADTTLHAGVPIGGTVVWPCNSSPPAGYLLCDGAAVSRTTYADLYTALGGASSPWGQGDGSTTFNLPSISGKFPLGRNSTSPYNAVGNTGGSLGHVHTTAAHTHTVGAHTHPMPHTHALNDHTHTGPAHTHSVPAHYHNATGNGATIQITASGSHVHTLPAWQNARSSDPQGSGRLLYGQASARLARVDETVGGSRQDSQSEFPDVSPPTHTHGNSSFSGAVGNVNSGTSGDSAMTSGSSGTGSTSGVSGGPGSTQGVSTPNTSNSTSFSSGSGGGDDTGAADPAYVVVDWIIRAL